MSLPINSRPLMVLRLATSATQDIGSTPQGKLTIFPVVGGSFEGDRLRGKVLAGGGDWVNRPWRRNLHARLAGHARDRRRRPDSHDVHWRAGRRTQLFPYGAAL